MSKAENKRGVTPKAAKGKMMRFVTAPSRKVLLRGSMTVAAAAAIGAAVVKLPSMMSHLSIFAVDRVSVRNTTYLDDDQVARIAGIDETSNIWDDRRPWVARLQAHPLVKSVRIGRRPPGTLTFDIVEATPVGLVSAPVLTPVDGQGVALPIDPSEPALNLPVLTSVGDSLSNRGTRILAEELARISTSNPEVFAVVSEARHEGKHVMLSFGEGGIRVLYAPPIGERRLLEAITVMNDALGRFPERNPKEIDLRYHDQVIVRYSS